MSKLKTTIEYLFYLLVFLLPWQARLLYHQGELNGGYWEYGSLALYGTELLLGLLFVLVIILAAGQIKKVGVRPNIKALDILLIGFLVLAGLSIIWSVNEYLSWQIWLVFVEVMALLYLASRTGWSYIKLASVFVFSALIQALLAIYQFITQTVWSNKWLGMSSQFVEDGGVSVVEGAGRWLRAYGSLPHPNMLGGFLAIGLLFMIGLLFWYQKKYYHPPWKVTPKFLLTAFGLFATFTIIIYGLLLSFSRSAWLGLVVALLLIWIVLFIKKDKQRLWFFLELNVIIVLVVVLFANTYGDLLSSRLNADTRLEARSVSERQIGWREAGEMIKDRPLFGTGLGTYTYALYQMDASRSSYEYQPVHNIDLLVMAELGIVGWLILTVAILYILYLALKKIRKDDSVELWILTAIYLAILVIGAFDHYLWSLYFGLMLSFLMVGLLIKKIQ